jgi:hypothetical protein
MAAGIIFKMHCPFAHALSVGQTVPHDPQLLLSKLVLAQ